MRRPDTTGRRWRRCTPTGAGLSRAGWQCVAGLLLGAAATWVAAASSSAPAAASAEGAVACAGAPARVLTERVGDAHLACDGALAAQRFLSPLGVEPKEPILIEMVRELPPGLRKDAVGVYAIQSRRLMVLELPDFLQRRTWFKVPVSATLYRSIVAHEYAHALVGRLLDGRGLPSAAHEYVAYVVMFATMDPATRASILRGMGSEGLRYDAEINDLRYVLDPMQFGVDAYLHWTAQADGMEFLRQVIRGEIAPDVNLLTLRRR